MHGFNTTERFVEIPWCLNRYRGERVVLDVGYSGADPAYLHSLVNLDIPTLYGIDITPPKHLMIEESDGTSRPLLCPVQADLRDTPFADDFFELIFCISTIEHIGLDNARYAQESTATQSAIGDFEAIRELSRITKPHGRLLLTIPFGRYENHGWFQQYDLNRLIRLVAASHYALQELDFFQYHNGWHECQARDLRARGYQSNGAPNAAGLACLELSKLSVGQDTLDAV